MRHVFGSAIQASDIKVDRRAWIRVHGHGGGATLLGQTAGALVLGGTTATAVDLLREGMRSNGTGGGI